MVNKTNKAYYALYIGLFAGIIWGGLKLIEFGIKFTNIPPGFLLDPFFKHAYLATWPGMLLGWGSFIVFSIMAAAIYMALLRKMKGPWIGVAYGVVWWLLIYQLIGPITGMVPNMFRMDRNSFVTDLCLFILWGLFIGYSIVVEFTDEQSREPVSK
jgi:uncharacterized membrane protein YagU involved in acid resistance